ncbi:hypothetical protein IKB17_00010 [bacterium]|nr:hypothetical protein [bacterium]
MKKQETDIFEGINNPIENNSSNFFLMEKAPVLHSQPKSETLKRLNDYDFNLLKEDAYKDVSDDLFKLEYKISKIEEEIKTNLSQLESARDIGDLNLINDLVLKKKHLEEDYEALIAIYNDKSFSAKISDKIISVFGANAKNKIQQFQSNIAIVSEKIISKMPKQFSTVIELRKSLNKLENLNKSVNDLMTLNIPYGENLNKYDQLSKYIIKANAIHADISQYLKK